MLNKQADNNRARAYATDMKWKSRNSPGKKVADMLNKRRASKLNRSWKQRQRKHQTIRGTLDSKNYEGMKEFFADPQFDKGMSDAYANVDGYKIEVNPVTGEKVMYIAGTRDVGQWMLNVFDIVGARVDVPRKKRVAQYNEIARREGVDVIYGHSRAAALVSDMDVPNARKVGVDGAMLLAYNDRDMVNYHEGGITGMFDELIAIGGKNNKRMNLGSHIHSVWS